MEIVTIVVMIALIEYNFFSFKVGAARVRCNVKAPAMHGNEEWERILRVQENTLEQLITFIPSIYGFAYFLNANWAAGLGITFIIGRFLYFLGYTKAANKRTKGFMLTFFSNQILLFGTIIGCVMSILKA